MLGCAKQTRVVKISKASSGRLGLAGRAKPPLNTVPNCTHVKRPRLSEASLLDPCRLPQHQLQAASCDRRYTRRLPSHTHRDCATISVHQCAMSTQQQQGRTHYNLQINGGKWKPRRRRTAPCTAVYHSVMAGIALRPHPMREPCPRTTSHRTTRPSALHGNHTQLLNRPA